MRFLVTEPGASREVDVVVDPNLVSVADLARALGAHPGGSDRDTGLLVDGQWAPGDLPLLDAGVHEGARLDLGTRTGPPPPPEGPIEVGVVGGLSAGGRFPLTPGPHLVGRGSAASVALSDPTVSRQHAELDVGVDGTVRVTDRSGGRTLADGRPVTATRALGPDTVVETGATAWVARPPAGAGPQRGGDLLTGTDRFRDTNANGVINLNRPPRYALPPAPGKLSAPKPLEKTNAAPFSLISMAVPLVSGVVLALVLKSPYYLAFALLSPMLAVGNWWESKHRSKKSLRGDTRRYQGELESFERNLLVNQAGEQQRRRVRTPDVAEALRRIETPSIHLWERRLGHEDFGLLAAGIGDVDWQPSLEQGSYQEIAPEVSERMTRYGRLISTPLAVNLADGGVIGVVGDREAALAVARSLLVQAAAHHGPADLRIAVVTAGVSVRAWDWSKWLPHTRDHRPGPSNRRLLGADVVESVALVEGLVASQPEKASAADQVNRGPVTMLVVDGEELLAGRASPARSLLRGDAGPSCGIVVAATADRLPSLCTSIITVAPNGSAKLSEPRLGLRDQDLLAAGMDEPTARRAARTLARYEDPELLLDSAILPELVPLPAILDLGEVGSGDVTARWRAQAGGFHLRAPIGAAAAGQFWLDFDRHGPHGLIGGTTGSGKSELLKTLVATFAACYPPSELTFGLFDFKGGSTFVEFADLPHTVGMASDLDVSLARRALQCLRAELLYRERVFDELGAKDLPEFRDRRQRLLEAGAAAPDNLPRLIVIIDEFAALASELAEEIGALTDLTARGRSLGVHLLLATQKPSTAVNAEIRTNTRLRISLQVEDKQDSVDVVGVPDAALIRQKGRGFFRVGSSEIVPIQTALASGHTVGEDASAVRVARFTFATTPRVEEPAEGPEVDAEDGPSDLARLVGAIKGSFATSGLARPRKPWPDPLPDRFDLADLWAIADTRPAVPDPGTVYFALADDPAAQTRYPVGWRLPEGNLILYGVVGSGTTTALTTLAVAFASSRSADDGHIYALDFGTGGLGPLTALPHCGSVVPATDRERQMRLIRMLRAELARRRQLSRAELDGEPVIMVLIDNLEAFRAEYDDAAGLAVMDEATRLFSEGPDAGIVVAATANRLGGVPAAITSATPQKLVMRLADMSDFSAFSIAKKDLPSFVPGRGVMADTHRVVHVATPGPDLAAEVAEVAARTPAPARPPMRVGSLPAEIHLPALGPSRIEADEWRLAVALGDANLGAAELVLYEREHACLAGNARSGKSTALLTLAAALRGAEPEATVLGIAVRRSPVRDSPLLDKVATTVEDVAAVLDQALVASGPTLVLIDDAEGIDDADMRINQILTVARANVHLAIAGRSDVLRTQYGHWTQTVRRSKAGLLLNPNLDLDGDLLGARLPGRLQIAMTQGRGFLVCDGGMELVQVALPS